MKPLKANLVFMIPFLAGLAFAQNSAAADNSNSDAPKIFGEITITTNEVEEGISISNNSVAMMPVVGYQWAHAQLGLFGTNVQYPDNAESLNLRPFAWFDFVFAPTVDIKARYDMNTFYPSTVRDGNIYTLDLDVSTHHILVQEITNWYGTTGIVYWLEYNRRWNAFSDFDYKFEVGYAWINTVGWQSYFAGKAGLAYKYSDFDMALMFAANSNPTQFANNTGGSTLYFEISTKF